MFYNYQWLHSTLRNVFSIADPPSPSLSVSVTWSWFVCCLCFYRARMFSCLVFLMLVLRQENYLKIPLLAVYTENIHYTLTSKLVLPASSFENIFKAISQPDYLFLLDRFVIHYKLLIKNQIWDYRKSMLKSDSDLRIFLAKHWTEMLSHQIKLFYLNKRNLQYGWVTQFVSKTDADIVLH